MRQPPKGHEAIEFGDMGTDVKRMSDNAGALCPDTTAAEEAAVTEMKADPLTGMPEHMLNT